MKLDFTEIERAIGYIFKDKALLKSAFTHSSLANEQGGEGNEKLEFLGDAVLNFIVAENLYDRGLLDEGEMSVKRSRIVSREPLAAEIDRMGLLRFLRVAGSFSSGQSLSVKFKSNVFEAVLGAIYKDGGIDAARAFVGRTLTAHIVPGSTRDYKTALQERVQSRGGKIHYSDEEISAVPPSFLSKVFIDDKEIAEGKGGSKKTAQQEAAKNALDLVLCRSKKD